MKTRIKVIKYGDGTTQYIPQEFSLEFHWAYFVPVVGQLFLLGSILERWTSLYSGEFGEEDFTCCFKTIEEAQEVIDKEIIQNLKDKEEIKKENIANKVISKSYIKYP